MRRVLKVAVTYYMLGSGRGRPAGQATHGAIWIRKVESDAGGIETRKNCWYLVATPCFIWGGNSETFWSGRWVEANTWFMAAAPAPDIYAAVRWPSQVDPSDSVYKNPIVSPGIRVAVDSTRSIRTTCMLRVMGDASTRGTGRGESRHGPFSRGCCIAGATGPMGIAVSTGCACASVRAERTMAASMAGSIRTSLPQIRVAAGLLAALLALCRPADAALATILPDGTYGYAVIDGGKPASTSGIVVTRSQRIAFVLKSYVDVVESLP